MNPIIGSNCPLVKINLSRDDLSVHAENMPMSRRKTPPAYKKAFLARTRAVREAAGLTQEQVAAALKMPARDWYKQYERRTMLPHEYIGPFADLCGTSCQFLLTGRHQGQPRRPFAKPA